MKRTMVLSTVTLLVLGGPALATFDCGSDGKDGIFAPSNHFTIDLAEANTVPTNDPSYVAGKGYYDKDLWVIIFNWESVTIDSGITVSFSNHPLGCPVMWLSQEDVTISGTVTLNGNGGAAQSHTSYATPGPGGFFGGQSGYSIWWATGGFGPGGPDLDSDWDAGGTGGSYATYGSYGGSTANVFRHTYGNEYILPLIGGSGGAGGWCSGSQIGGCGGAGGGAILIASSGNIYLNGAVQANGGNGGAAYYGYRNHADGGGGGAGGAIRLMCNEIYGHGTLRATGGGGGAGSHTYGQVGGSGGNGYLRIEATYFEVTDLGSPAWTSSYEPGLVYPPANYPSVRVTHITAVDGDGDPIYVAVGDQPHYSPDTTEHTLERLVNPATFHIEAHNIPIDTNGLGPAVDVHVVPLGPNGGDAFWVGSSRLSGTFATSTATAEVTLPVGYVEIQLQGDWTPEERSATSGKDAGDTLPKVSRENLPRYRQMNDVVGIEVVPGSDRVTYVTGGGRRVTYPAGLLEGASRSLTNARK
ncbi:MAG: hypothetical protein KAV82_09560 [Phycisphaerae bacterium]|nr:hypothetical protein [Phycisphaerae bacterium]